MAKVCFRLHYVLQFLLMLWKANLDIQFVAESSLALAHYVSGYVTKAEKSNMQEIWDEVSGRLWSFGIRSLHFRECGLYEASDLLLGDHLNEKSDTVKWIDVSMPHKRNRFLINHKLLQEIAKHNPDSEEIFEDNLIDTFYVVYRCMQVDCQKKIMCFNFFDSNVFFIPSISSQSNSWDEVLLYIWRQLWLE